MFLTFVYMGAIPETILVTGACGFVGQHLCQTLLREGQNVVGFGRVPSDPDKQRFLDVATRNGRFAYCSGDLRSSDDLKAALQQYRPDAVIHLGAMAKTDPGDQNHTMLWDVNVGGTQNLVRAVENLALSPPPIVSASTVRVYDGNTGRVDGTTSIDPNKIGPYARSKLAAERITIGCGGSVVRLPNAYGPGQRPGSGIVSSHIDTTLRGGRPEVHGSGDQRIDLTYNDDFVRAILAVARGQQGTVYAVGSGEPLTVRDAAIRIQAACGMSPENIRTVPLPTGAVEGGIYWVDSSEMRGLGWIPETSLTDGLGQTVAWHRSRLNSGVQRQSLAQQRPALPLPAVVTPAITPSQIPLGAA